MISLHSCKDCSESFTSRLDLKNHLSVNHKTCNICNKKFECKKTLEQHEQHLHPSLTPPNSDIIRKTYVLGMILPIFIRREGWRIFKFLSAEEQGESLHKLMNEFERQYASISYKPKRYLAMKRAYVNRKKLK